MNKKAIMWGDVKDILIMMAIIALILWVLSSMVAKGVVKQTDCKKNQGYCAPICGAGSYEMIQYKCNAKEDSCCFDELALKGERPPELTEPKGINEMSCSKVQAEISRANLIIWQKMAAKNPNNSSICRKQEELARIVTPCPGEGIEPQKTCKYEDMVADCAILAKLTAQETKINNQDPKGDCESTVIRPIKNT